MISYSIELFPPRGGKDLRKTLELACSPPVQPPTFVSLTSRYGEEQVTFSHAQVLIKEGYKVAAHLLHSGSSKAELKERVQRYYDVGVEHIVALRGDQKTPHLNDPAYFSTTIAFIAALRNWFPALEISVAGYPDTHPDATDWQQDITFLRDKVDAGADRVLTQLFFAPSLFVRFVQRAREKGIHLPIVPGLMPITNFAKLLRFASRCQVTVPGNIHRLFKISGDLSQQHLLAMSLLTSQVQKLHELGINHFHFYMLNMPLLLRPFLHWLYCCQNSFFSSSSPLASRYQ